MAESLKMNQKLQGNRRTHISQNGKGIEHGIDGYQAVEVYRRGEHGRAPFSSATERKSEGLRVAEGVLSPGNDGVGAVCRGGAPGLAKMGGGVTGLSA